MARLLLSLLAVFLCGCSGSRSPLATGREVDLRPHFEGFTGCFVMLDTNTGQVTRYHPRQCQQRLSPCSTFKIPNSLIALETGVIRGADHVLTWDGVQRSRESLNRDHDLRSALANSVVWYYQEIARQVGAGRMQFFLDAFDYGNRDISGGIDRFWLGSTLKISADEQVAFLRKLQAGDLSVSTRAMDIVKDITIQPWSGPGILRGKTGSQTDGDRGILGWYVGWVTTDRGVYVFACNIEATDGASGMKAKGIALEILRDLLPDRTPSMPVTMTP